MSVRTLSRVWEGSRQKGSALLMLLAIADFADDDGNAYPSVPKLAAKCRMTPRNANHILADLRRSGELEVRENEGPYGTNRYRVLSPTEPLKPASPLKSASPLKPASSTPEAGFPKPLKPASDEPSLNRQEPSDRSKSAAGRLPPCPAQAIVQLYHDALPELPRVRDVSTKREARLRDLWAFTLKRLGKGATTAQRLDWIRRYFERARLNDFVMGRAGRGRGHETWRTTIDYLCREDGRNRVLEQTALPEEVAA